MTLRPEGGAVTGIALPGNVTRSLERLFGDEPADPAPEGSPRSQPHRARMPTRVTPRQQRFRSQRGYPQAGRSQSNPASS